MIDQLTDAECEITECVGRKVNEVIEAVHALDGITKWLTQHVGRWAWKEHEATRDGGQAADPVEAPTVEDRLEAMQATWQIMSESYTDACAEAKRLRAERDAAHTECERLRNENARLHERAGLAVLDKGLSDVLFTWGGVVATARRQLATYRLPERQAPVNSCIVDLYDALVQARTERDAAQARVRELEADAALGALVRRAVETHRTVEIARSQTGYHDVLLNGHIDVHGKRHAIHGGGRKLDDALRAALGEGREEGE